MFNKVYRPKISITSPLEPHIHQHACLFYKRPAEGFAVTTIHLSNGLKLGEQCIYILPQEIHSKVKKLLKEKNSEIDKYLESGQLILMDSQDSIELLLNEDPKSLLNFLVDQIAEYEKSNLKGLRIVMDMNWTAKESQVFDNLIKFERLAETKLLQKGFTSIISEYNINEFTSAQVEEILHAYPYVIIDEAIHQNIYYIPDLKQDNGRQRLEAMFGNVINYTNALQGNDSAFLSLMNSLNDVVIVLDKNQKVVDVFGKWFEKYDIATNEMLGKSLEKFMLEQNIPHHRWVLGQVLKGKSMVYEWQGNKPGQELYVGMSLAPLRNDKKKIIGMVAVAHDITERKLDDRKITELLNDLEQNKERLENIVSTLPGVVWESENDPTSKAQKITYISSYVEEMLGYPVHDWLTIPNFWSQIVHPEDRNKAIEVASEKYKNTGRRVNQFRWITKDGRELWIEAQSITIQDKQGNPIGMRGVNVDITATKLLEKQKDEFVSVASHELKTPITTIKAFTDLHKIHSQKTGDTKSLEYLQRIDSQVGKVTKLIRDMLDVSKIQAGKLDYNFSKFDIGELVEESVKDMQLISEKHTIKLENKVHQDISADRYRMGQVLTNLISNAIKYSPESSEIKISMQKAKKTIQITVQDFGIGISKAKAKMIFERFYQVSNPNQSTPEKLPSLGLGLYISSEIIKRHDGKIWVESEEGKGSTFFIQLPV